MRPLSDKATIKLPLSLLRWYP